MNKKTLYISIILIFLFSVAARIVFIDYHGLWNNEFITVEVIKNPWNAIYHERITNNHMPLYFYLCKLSVEILGMTESAMRLPSVIFGSLFVFAVFFVVLKIGNIQKAALAAFVAGFHEVFVETTLDARPYILMALTVVISLYFFYRMTTRAKKTDYALYLFFTMLGIFNHLFFIIVIPLNVFYLTKSKIKDNRLYVFTMLPVIVLVFPIILWMQTQYFTEDSKWRMFSISSLFRTIFFLVMGEDSNLLTNFSRVLTFPAFFWLVYRYFTYKPESQEHQGFRTLVRMYYIIPLVFILLTALMIPNVLGSLRYYTVSIAVFPFIVADIILGNKKISSFEKCAGILLFCSSLLYISAGYILLGECGIRPGINYLEKNFTKDSSLLVCKYSGAMREAFEFYDQSSIPYIKVKKDDKDEALLNSKLEEASKNKKYIWILMYHYGNNRIDKLVQQKYKLIEKVEFNQVCIYKFDVNQGLEK